MKDYQYWEEKITKHEMPPNCHTLIFAIGDQADRDNVQAVCDTYGLKVTFAPLGYFTQVTVQYGFRTSDLLEQLK